MKKLAISILAAASLAFVGFATLTPTSATAGKDCARKEFKTTLLKDACTKGGQDEAKKVMKKFMASAKKQQADISCKTCHAKLAPGYELSKDGLEKFKTFGGK